MQTKHAAVLAALAMPALFSATPAAADDRPVELGAFAGYHFFSDTNELGADDGDAGRGPADSFIFGVRLGVPVTKAITVEGELGLIPTESRADAKDDTLVLAWRGNALYHVDVTKRARLFGLVGAGATSQARSDLGGLAADTDFVAHAGVGAKYHVRDNWGVRLDARMLVPPSTDGDNALTTDWEITVGIARVYAQPAEAAPAPPPAEEPAPPPPPPPAEDPAPPPPPAEEPPPPPPEPPAAVKKFTGAIEGIQFAHNSDKLVGRSSKVLDAAVAMLAEYTAVRLEIAGHTDDTGSRDHNIDLSQRRAESVRTYMVGKGVAADRLEARGYGPDRPAVTGTTAAARAKNRRVEFTVLAQ